MGSSNVFCYDTLTLDHNRIRLLKVLPATPKTDLVRCEIFHATTSDAYSALSYTWGSVDYDRTILVNNKSMTVRVNLWEFLTRVSLTPEYAAKALWIDAVCINQGDEQEKSYQVARMGIIYENAQEVLIWLAPLRKLSQGEEFLPIRPFREMASCLPFEYRSQLTQTLPPYTSCSAYIIARYLGEQICRHEYWKRLWIVQEFLLHQKRTVIYGSFAIPWEIMAVFQEFRVVAGQKHVQQDLSLWLALMLSPLNLIKFTIGHTGLFKDYVEREQLDFAVAHGLLPLPFRAIHDYFPAVPRIFLQWLGGCLPGTFRDIVTWYLSTHQDPTSSMLDVLRDKANIGVDPYLHTKSGFLLTLQLFAEQKCFDRRDKIYGLAALARTEGSIKVDYTLTTEDVYLHTLDFLSKPREPEKEPCTMRPHIIAHTLMIILALKLCDFGGSDLNKHSTNILLVPVTNRSTVRKESIPCPNREHDCGKTFKDCTQISVDDRGPTGCLIECSACNTQVVFDAARLAHILEIQKNARATSSDPTSDVNQVLAVLQCRQITSQKKRPPLVMSPVAILQQLNAHQTRSQSNILSKDSNHLLLYHSHQSYYPHVILDTAGTMEYDRLMCSMSTEAKFEYKNYFHLQERSHPPISASF